MLAKKRTFVNVANKTEFLGKSRLMLYNFTIYEKQTKCLTSWGWGEQTPPVSEIRSICDFRCCKQKSEKQPDSKIMDFDSVVKNTKSQNSLFTARLLSMVKLCSSQATDRPYFAYRRLFVPIRRCILFGLWQIVKWL